MSPKHDMLLAVAVPAVILAAGVTLALTGHTRNRQLTIGLTIILAVLGLVAVLARNPAVLR